MLAVMKKGDSAALQEAVMLQGLLSGDIFAANIAARTALQNENMRLRTRVAREKIRTERLKQKLLSAALPNPNANQFTQEELVDQIRELYGLRPESPERIAALAASNAIEIRRHDILEGRTIEVKALPEKPDQPVLPCK